MEILASIGAVVVFAFAVGVIDEGIGRFAEWWGECR